MRKAPELIPMRLAFLSLLVIAFGVIAACGDSSKEETVITVYAAASLSDAFRDITGKFEARHPDVAVKLNFAGSQRLRSQLELGAAADVFASADEVQMALAEEAGLIAGSSRPFASATMSVIASSDSEIKDISQIAAPGVKLALAHESVPAGQYSRRLLARLSEPDADLAADFADRVLENLVSEETSVKFVEQKVVLGQADAGVVYRPGAITAEATGSARELPMPSGAESVRAVYPIAVLTDSNEPDWAAEFVEFVLSHPSQAILSGYGFDAP